MLLARWRFKHICSFSTFLSTLTVNFLKIVLFILNSRWRKSRPSCYNSCPSPCDEFFNLLLFFYLSFTEQKYFKLAPNSDLMHWYVILCHLFLVFVPFSKTRIIPQKTSPTCYRVYCSQFFSWFFPKNINNLLFLNYFLVLHMDNGNKPTFALAFERYSTVFRRLSSMFEKVRYFAGWMASELNQALIDVYEINHFSVKLFDL